MNLDVVFRLDELKPDRREFKQQSMLLIPTKALEVIVRVPCTNEYVYNSEKINAATLGNDNTPTPLFTPAGLFYIHGEFEKFFSDPTPEDFELVPSEEEWDNDEEKKEALTEDSDDGWDDDEDESTEDEKWDENEEEW
jgi:hypothetical protein